MAYNILIDRPSVYKELIMRIVKQAEQRKEEILICALKMFAEKGFRNTSVNSILEELHIAKGTFYYYFKSKEEILDAALLYYIDKLKVKLEQTLSDVTLPASEKFVRVVLQASENDDIVKCHIISAIHQSGNELLHEKSLVLSVECMLPILVRIVEEGNSEGCFHVRYVQTTVETILIAAQFMFDERYFAHQTEDNAKRLQEYVSIVESLLGVEEGTYEKMIIKLQSQLLQEEVL